MMQAADRFKFKVLRSIGKIGQLLIEEASVAYAKDRMILEHLPGDIRERFSLSNGVLRFTSGAFTLQANDMIPGHRNNQ